MGPRTDEKTQLLSSSSSAGLNGVDYGTSGMQDAASRKAAAKSRIHGKVFKSKPKKASIKSLFRYATRLDKFLLAIGTVFAILHGASWPLLAIVFGNMTNTFIKQTQAGFVDNTVHNTTASLMRGTSITPYVDSQNSSFSGEVPTVSAMISAVTDFLYNVEGVANDMFSAISKEEFDDFMNQYALMYVYIAIAVFLASFIHVWCWMSACERQCYRLRQEFFYEILRKEISWFDEHQSGELTTKLNDDIERIKEGLGDKFGLFIHYMSTFVCGFLVGFAVGWQLTLVILAVTPLLALTSAFLGKVVSSSAAREQEKYAIAGGVAEEVLSAVRTVASFCGQKREVTRYVNALEEGKRLAVKKYFMLSLGFGFTFVVLYGAYALAFWCGSLLIASGRMDGGSVFTVFFAVMIGSFSLGNAVPQITSIATAQGSAGKIHEIIDKKPNIDPYSASGEQLRNFKANISFKKVNFTYPSRSEIQILRDFSINVQEGQTVALCGPSGSGKSTVISLVLRFYDPSMGEVTLNGHNLKYLNTRWLRSNIGLVSQEPVLFDYTIAENIAFGNEGVPFRDIEKAARMANAHEFITALPQGYDTMVGDRGAQLSGGQKQRIAIARALVRDPKILLLDEATSALDAESEAIVQQALDKARQGRTTIVVAHRLSTIKDADVIYVLENGHVVEQGNHQDLMNNEGVYYQLVTNQVVFDEGGYSTTEQTSESGAAESTSKYKGRRRRSTLTKSMEYMAYSYDREVSRLADDLVIEDVPLPSAFKILRAAKNEWKYILCALVSSILVGGSLPVFAIFYSEIFETFTLVGQALKDAAFFWSMMFLVLAAVSGVAHFFRMIGFGLSGENLTFRLRNLAFSNILRQHVGWFDNEKHSSGKLTTRLATDVPFVKTAAGHRLGILLTAVVTLATSIILAFIFGWKLALALLFVVPVLFAAGSVQMKVEKGNQKRDVELMANAGKVAAEGIENVRTVQGLTLEQTFYGKFVNHLLLPYIENKKHCIVFALSFAFSQGVMFLIYAGAFRLGAYLITIGDMDAINVYRVFFAMAFSAVSIGQWTSYLPDYTKAQLSAALIFHLIETVPEIDSYSTGGVTPDIKGKVTFKDVHFTYPNRPGVPVLRGVNLIVESGQTLALVGPSGCGKSTVISLLQRFYDPQHGQVIVDDFDIRTINLTHLRTRMSVVSQEPVLFNCSIRDNIMYGVEGRVTQEQIEAAAKTANIHSFIKDLPLGYDTVVGERGTQLSGGQKQRIAIARALVRNPTILLLDEATSALDTESEKLVQEALDRAKQGRTCIIVAHRLSTIQGADCIAVIDKGKIIEQGTHEQLVTMKGLYYQLTKRQRIRH